LQKLFVKQKAKSLARENSEAKEMFQKTISTTCLKSKSKRRWALGAEMRKRAFKRGLLNLQKTSLSKKLFKNTEKNDENQPLFIKNIQILYSLFSKKILFFVVVVCKQILFR
jgi:hypothetical protein